MLGGRQNEFFSDRLKIKIFSIIFAVLCVFAVSIAYCSQTQQNSNTNAAGIQDSNTTVPVIPAVSDTADVDITAGLTEKKLQEQKQKITESRELSDEIKAKINEIYDQAITQLKQAVELETKKQDYSQRRKNAPADLEKLKEQLAGQQTFAAPEVAADITLSEAEQKLTEATLALEQAKKTSSTWENEPKRRADRRTQIPEESNTAKQRLDEIKGKLAAAVVEGQNPELVRANRSLLMAQQRALEAQIAMNTEELLFFDARRDVLAANRDLAARQLAYAGKLAEFWQQKVNALRQKQAQAAQKEAIRAKEETKYADPAIQKIAERNVELAKIQAELVKKVEKTSQYSKQIDEQLAAIEKDFQDIQVRVDKTGKITNVLGVLLLTKRKELPDISENKKNLKARLSEITKAQLDWFKYDKEWSELSNPQLQAQDEIDKVTTPMDEKRREAVLAEVMSYLESRRKTLDVIKGLYDGYLTDLANLDAKESSFIQKVQEYEKFIDENILWIKSSSALNANDISEIAAAFQWLTMPGHWQHVAKLLWDDLKNTPLAYAAIIMVFVLSLVLHKRMHRLVEDISKKVLDVDTDSFLHTLKAFLLTVLLAATWPVVILFLRWRLDVNVSGDDFTQALVGGLRDLAVIIFIFELLRHATMPGGLMPVHFRVREESLAFTRKHIRWLFVLLIPLTFVLRILQLQETNDRMYDTMGRLIFIGVLVILGFFTVVFLNLKGPIVGPYLKRRPEGWVTRLRYFWYPLCPFLTLGFAVLAAAGYFYAAWHLYVKLMHTLVLVFLVIVLRIMITRWLVIIRRRLSLIEVQKRRAAREEAQANAPSSAPSETETSQQSKDKPETTIFEISQQTNRLINVIIAVLIIIGLWYIWQDVLPALSALGEARVWGEAPQIITLGNLVLAIIVGFITFIIARNVPGLLEIIILRRLPIDRGVRFAIITICRYILVVVGIVIAFTEIGIGWSKVQWLVAAMTVGLGFGLQEIFANFISGLIILLEQPVRVDDVVTVGDVTGVVTKIKIRATTIRKWDQRELVVPNKEFITGRLINWTLSDNILRRDFIVGIAYGSDIAKAERTLYEVAKANPLVLENPKPIVLFRSFGNSSLEFELRVCVAGIENYLPVWHGINCAIDEAFRKAEIEIAFPQQDLHIRSVKTNIPVDLRKPPEFA
ncbi:MAG: mechanosensitive ion channel [Sedimentisphaerales bacterium]|nr:mechanosensitive ion channel [Sedimentisphaerales bacterium]